MPCKQLAKCNKYSLQNALYSILCANIMNCLINSTVHSFCDELDHVVIKYWYAINLAVSVMYV